MDRGEAMRRLEAARVAHMATLDENGDPHVVPFVFALEGDTLYWAVDRKRKRSRALKRLANIEANPRVQVVIDRYQDEDWSLLWWVRASGRGRVVRDESEHAHALALLSRKYSQYRDEPPEGATVAVDLDRVTAWEAGGD